MKGKLLVLAAVAMFAVAAFGAVGHASAQGPVGTPPVSSGAVAPSVDTEPQSAVDTDTTQDQSGARVGGQVEDGAPDGAEMKSAAPDTDTIQSGAQGGLQIEDGLPETTAPESGG